jgi:para-nitrobenzyl esterase
MSEAARPEVSTQYGRVRGVRERGAEVFRGVRYGASTAGANRFRVPQPPTPWAGVFDASTDGPQCPQLHPTGTLAAWASLFATTDATVESGEDCLRLNVFTPASDRTKRPVMVWIHGGFYTVGSGNQAIYDGTNLAVAGDVVVVTVTHRINLYGYLCLDGLGGRGFEHAPNVGHLDLVQALGWVRDNIAAFGGNPGQVTLFGQSGGSRKIAVLMSMPAAKGLFHRAILSSGPALTVAPKDYGHALAEALLKVVGVSRNNVRALQDIPLDALQRAHREIAQSPVGQIPPPGVVMGGFSPVLDDAVIPSHPFSPAAPPLCRHVSMLLGTNRDEQSTMPLCDPTISAPRFGERALHRRVAATLGTYANAVIAAYRAHMPKATATDLLVAIETARLYWSGSVKVAERKAAQAPPVYMYRFDWSAPGDLGVRLKACHGLDVPFVFGNLSALRDLAGDSAEAHRLAINVGQAWVAFAKSGDPSHPGIPTWQHYLPTRATMIIDADWRMEDDPLRWAREVWSTVATEALVG